MPFGNKFCKTRFSNTRKKYARKVKNKAVHISRPENYNSSDNSYNSNYNEDGFDSVLLTSPSLDELELVSANSDHSSSLNWSEYEEEPCLQGDITEATEDSRDSMYCFPDISPMKELVLKLEPCDILVTTSFINNPYIQPPRIHKARRQPTIQPKLHLQTETVEMIRCKVLGCEFRTPKSAMLEKHMTYHLKDIINLSKFKESKEKLKPQPAENESEPQTKKLKGSKSKESEYQVVEYKFEPQTEKFAGSNLPAVSECNPPAVSECNQPAVSECNPPATSECNQPAVSECKPQTAKSSRRKKKKDSRPSDAGYRLLLPKPCIIQPASLHPNIPDRYTDYFDGNGNPAAVPYFPDNVTKATNSVQNCIEPNHILPMPILRTEQAAELDSDIRPKSIQSHPPNEYLFHTGELKKGDNSPEHDCDLDPGHKPESEDPEVKTCEPLACLDKLCKSVDNLCPKLNQICPPLNNLFSSPPNGSCLERLKPESGCKEDPQNESYEPVTKKKKRKKRSRKKGAVPQYTGPFIHRCTECDFTTTIGKLFTAHMHMHRGTFIECEVPDCVYKTRRPDFFTHHMMRAHNPDFKAKVMCHLCGKEVAKHSLRKHIRRMHEPKDESKLLKCQFCNFTSYYTRCLRVHELIHTGVKPHRCPHCDYSSTQKINLTTHMRRHSGNKPYKCPECDYSAAHNVTLKGHIRAKHPEYNVS